MAAQAITYSTAGRKRDLRTVVVEDVRTSVVLLPTVRQEIMTGRLLDGTSSRHDWWAEILGLPADSYDFAVAADQVVAQHPIQIAVKVKTRKRSAK